MYNIKAAPASNNNKKSNKKENIGNEVVHSSETFNISSS